MPALAAGIYRLGCVSRACCGLGAVPGSGVSNGRKPASAEFEVPHQQHLLVLGSDVADGREHLEDHAEVTGFDPVPHGPGALRPGDEAAHDRLDVLVEAIKPVAGETPV